MASTQGGKHLWSRLFNQEVRNKSNFTMHKRRLGKMWREYLGFCKPNLLLRGPTRFWDQECLWYIMNACVIMHNMIIEDDRGKNEDHTHYELMGFPCKWVGPHIGWLILLPRIIPFVPMIHMRSFKNISGKDNNSAYDVVLFEKLCCIVDEQLVVFVVNNLMYLLYYLLVL
jgi:hypothetical protein